MASIPPINTIINPRLNPLHIDRVPLTDSEAEKSLAEEVALAELDANPNINSIASRVTEQGIEAVTTFQTQVQTQTIALQEELPINTPVKDIRFQRDINSRTLSNVDWDNYNLFPQIPLTTLQENLAPKIAALPALTVPERTTIPAVPQAAPFGEKRVTQQNYREVPYEQLSELFAIQIHSVFHIHKISERDVRSSNIEIPQFSTTISQLSLPEVIMYYELLTQPWGNNPIVMLLYIKQARPLIIEMIIQEFPNRKKIYQFRYDYQLLKTDIFDETEKLGFVRYIIRNTHLEEIDGLFKGRPLVLDPVWTMHRRNPFLKEETMTIGEIHVTLINDHSNLHSALQSDSNPNKIVMSQITNTEQPYQTWTSDKQVRIKNLYGEGRSIFTKNVLMPVAAQFIFQRIPK